MLHFSTYLGTCTSKSHTWYLGAYLIKSIFLFQTESKDNHKNKSKKAKNGKKKAQNKKEYDATVATSEMIQINDTIENDIGNVISTSNDTKNHIKTVPTLAESDHERGNHTITSNTIGTFMIFSLFFVWLFTFIIMI